ncbi:hypothetical protein BAE44_0004638 [Dichanthelium oligosanthes]|uniref:AB hydrolase-1 domain-containing protein n=1 Tax=Dichanthelium oligosanthes TaxID=888268 RepID=A0A1E5WAB2_9POAL|nr:hypothetical protein BAE44_0004638 [Dichanthelium oligosanthes]
MEAEAAAEVRHWTADVNGISLHVAESGPSTGPAVLLIHGFPELWLSWRHQMAALAARGFRALAPDLRGYGDSSVPADPAAYSIFHIVGDLVALLDHLRLPKEPGRAERAFGRYDVATVLKRFYALEIDELIAPPGVEIIDFLEAPSPPLPWMTEEELGQYAKKFQKTGFTGPLNYYRMVETNWKLTAPWSGAKIIVPAKFILGEKDVGLQSLGTEKYVKCGGLKSNVPNLEVSIIEGHHFLQQEQAKRVNSEILSFLDKFASEEASA